KRINSIIWGLALLAVSAVLILNAFEITNIEIFFDGWWTLFIIVPSLVGLFGGHDKTANIIGLLIGTFLLLACQNIIDFDIIWKLVAPVIIAVIGIKMIFGGIGRNGGFIKSIEAKGDDIETAFAAFTGQDITYDNEIFRGAELTAVFGGIKCDLRNAVFEGDTVINACCIFGGVDILLPDNVNIKVNSNSLFGGIDNKKHQNSNDNQYTVYLNGTCIFGGVDVK
ncbi:MAG: LiaF-related protein, partial [Clostridiales bacterium]|nr:LiaF-related protein [Clostridiales bacterium]